MRIFKKFNSFRIAKYVRGFFRGTLYVSGLGFLEFQQGLLLIPSDAGNMVKMRVSEVNREIKRFDV
jgi:hypothetical protein